MKKYLKSLDLLWLSMLAFVLVSTTAIYLNKPSVGPDVLSAYDFNLTPLPILKDGRISPPLLSAQGVLAVDLNSGIFIFEKNIHESLYPASTTKLMTALIALEQYDSDAKITVPDFDVVGQKMGLFAGEQMQVSQLVSAMLIFSANDAAEVLARAYPSGRDGFIELMNEKAQALGLSNTHFENPAGLDSEENYSTAYDLYRLSRLAVSNSFIADTVSTKNVEIRSTDQKSVHRLQNTNELLGVVDGVSGIKTGWTQAARENLITLLEREEQKIILVVLGSQDRFGETQQLIDWIFESYEWKSPQDIYPYYSLVSED